MISNFKKYTLILGVLFLLVMITSCNQDDSTTTTTTTEDQTTTTTEEQTTTTTEEQTTTTTETVLTDVEKVDEAKTELSLGNVSNVTEDLTLPSVGEHNTSISWSSNKPDVITNEGVVIRSETDDVVVTLTATITLNDAEDTKTFEVTVKQFVVLTVAEALQASKDEVINVRGVVSLVTSKRIVIQDPDGTGIYIWLGTYPTVNNGDLVTVRGLRYESNGIPEIKSVEFVSEPISTGNEVVKTVVTDLDAFRNSDVSVFGKTYTFENVTVTSSNAYYIEFYEKTFDGNKKKMGLWLDDIGQQVTLPEIETNDVITFTATLFAANGSYDSTELWRFMISDSNDIEIVQEYISTDEENVAKDKAALQIDDFVLSDLTLPSAGENGSDITWSSSNTDVITDAGVVTRSANEDVTVTLTATITINDDSDTKEFEVVVFKQGHEDNAITVSEALAANNGDTLLVKGVVSAITSQRMVIQDESGTGIYIWLGNLPTVEVGDLIIVSGNKGQANNIPEMSGVEYVVPISKGHEVVEFVITDMESFRLSNVTVFGKTYTFENVVVTNSNSTYLEFYEEMFISGKKKMGIYLKDVNPNVSIPVVRTGDVITITVTLFGANGEYETAELWRFALSDSNDIEVIIDATDEEKVEIAKNDLDLGNLTGVTSDLNLPTEGLHGTTITWSSDNTDVITDGGVVVRPDTNDATVTLTATITLNDASITKEFVVTVLAVETVEPVLTVSEALQANTGEVISVKGIVSLVTAKRLVIQDTDGTGIFIWVGSLPSVNNGDLITVKGLRNTSNGIPEIKSVESISEPESTGNAVAKTVITDIDAFRLSDASVFGKTYTFENVLITKVNSYYIEFYEKTFDGNLKKMGLYMTDVNPNVVFPSLNPGDKVTLTTTLYGANGQYDTAEMWRFMISDSNDITITDPYTDEEKVNEAKAALDLGDLTAVVSPLTLPTEGLHGSTITWASSNADVITTEGFVTRQDLDTTVTLTATITLNDVSVSVDFTVTVLAKEVVVTVLTVSEALQANIDEVITFKGVVSLVTSKRIVVQDTDGTGIYIWVGTLPTVNTGDLITVTGKRSVSNGIPEINSVEYISDPESIDNPVAKTVVTDLSTFRLSDASVFGKTYTFENVVITKANSYYIEFFEQTFDGNLKKMGLWLDDVNPDVVIPEIKAGYTVTMTATLFAANGQFDTAEMWRLMITDSNDLVIEDESYVLDAKNDLSLTDYTFGNMTLPTVGTHNATISWESNNTDVISTDGVVTRQATDEVVTLTATITYNGVTDTKTFDVTVYQTGYEDTAVSAQDAINANKGDLLFVKGVVSAITKTRMVIQDNDGTGIYIWLGKLPTVEVGDLVLVNAKRGEGNGIPELSSVTSTLIVSKGHDVVSTVVTDMDALRLSDTSVFGKTYTFENVVVTNSNSVYLEFYEKYFDGNKKKMGVYVSDLNPNVTLPTINKGDTITLTITLFGANGYYNTCELWRFALSDSADITVVSID